MKKRLLSALITISIVWSTMLFTSISASAATQVLYPEIIPTGLHYCIPSTLQGIDSDSFLNVRTGPGTQYAVICRIKSGYVTACVESKETLTTRFGGTTWTYIECSINGVRYEGWVSRQYINFNNNNNYRCGMVNDIEEDSFLNVRSGPSTSYSRIGTLKNHAPVYIINSITVNGKVAWYYVIYDMNKKGYISADYCVPYDRTYFAYD